VTSQILPAARRRFEQIPDVTEPCGRAWAPRPPDPPRLECSQRSGDHEGRLLAQDGAPLLRERERVAQVPAHAWPPEAFLEAAWPLKSEDLLPNGEPSQRAEPDHSRKRVPTAVDPLGTRVIAATGEPGPRSTAVEAGPRTHPRPLQRVAPTGVFSGLASDVRCPALAAAGASHPAPGCCVHGLAGEVTGLEAQCRGRPSAGCRQVCSVPAPGRHPRRRRRARLRCQRRSAGWQRGPRVPGRSS
jgi:hypothetical protein